MSQSLNKITTERNQRALLELANEQGNDVCADCKARHPRWASHNLGIFLCMNCASVHRKMGTHISKVKSITLDSWTKEQVESMKQHGNVKSNAYYNPDEVRHPPPTNMIDSERDSDLEKYIRSKYEYKSFITRSSQVAALLGPSSSASSRLSSAPPRRSQTVPLHKTEPTLPESAAPPTPPPKPSAATAAPASTLPSSPPQVRSASQPVFASLASPTRQQVQPAVQTLAQTSTANFSWANTASLQTSASTTAATLTSPYATASTLPVTSPFAMANTLPATSPFATATTLPSTSSSQSIPVSSSSTLLSPTNPYSALSLSPGSPFPSTMNQQLLSGGIGRSGSLNTGLSANIGVGLSPNMNIGGAPAFQPQQTGFGFSAILPTQAAVPSLNPFQQAPSTGSSTGSFGSGLGMSGMAMGQQPPTSLTPFSPSPFQPDSNPSFPQSTMPQLQSSSMFPAQQLPPPQASPLFPTQSLGQVPMHQMQGPASANPFLQHSQPQMQPPVSAPAAFGIGAQLPFGQMQAQQQQQVYTGNPFATWQQGAQGHYNGQQWNGM